MRIAGIIAEYNPLHTGHVYHMNRTRQITGAEGIVVVMSGNYVQRGEPAIVDKYRRTRMALAAGADLVLELPVSWATGSAERFASGAAEILDRLGVITDLTYGCECGEQDLLERAAGALMTESEGFRKKLQDAVKAGLSYPQARADALEEEVPGARELLSSPNNILAVEYRKELLRRGSGIRCHGILRVGAGYRDEVLPEEGDFASATALREAMEMTEIPVRMEVWQAGGTGQAEEESRLVSKPGKTEDDVAGLSFPELAKFLPDETRRNLDYAVYSDDLTLLLHHSLQSRASKELLRIQDMSPELLNRLTALRGELLTFRETAKLLKRTNIAHTRINRALLHLVLGMEEPDPGAPVPAVRLLGFRKGTPVMRMLQDSSGIPIVTKPADADPSWFAQDVRACGLYRALVWRKTGIRVDTEYQAKPVIL